jgi:hypothetical protein
MSQDQCVWDRLSLAWRANHPTSHASGPLKTVVAFKMRQLSIPCGLMRGMIRHHRRAQTSGGTTAIHA